MSRGIGIGATLLFVSSCHSYEAKPLHAEAHLARWGDRLNEREVASEWDARASTGMAFDPEDGLALDEALAVARLCNARLRAVRLELAVRERRVENAERWADPSLGLNLLRAIEATSKPWLITGSLTAFLPAPGLRAARRAQAEAGLGQQVAELEGLERQVLQQLEQAWLDWSFARAELEILAEQAADLERLRADVGRLQSAGSLPASEGRRLAIEAGRLEGRRRQRAAEADEQRLRVLALMGLRPDTPWPLEALRRGRAIPAEPATLEQAALGDPRVAVARAEYQRAEAALQQACAQQWPGLSLGPSAEAEDGIKLGPAVQSTIPIWNRGQGAVAVATAQRDVARARFEAVLEQQMAAHAAARLRFDNAQARLQFLRAELEELAQEQLEEVRRLARLGELDPDLLLESWRTVLELRVERLEAEAALERARSLRSWLLQAWMPPTADTEEER